MQILCKYDNILKLVKDQLSKSDGIVTDDVIKQQLIDVYYKMSSFIQFLNDNKIEVVTNRDAAYAFVKAIDYDKELKGKIYNVGGGENSITTYKELIINNSSRYTFKIFDDPTKKELKIFN